ncbi:alcohol dehydrogenase [Cutaneotrichosporon oleaginosum]|uniref:Alcohol dehydrogenase n=1 Tax=Cutaneotrichosporon oleaginosum TaxID=879819 RepID=A0A0J0XEY6_9TREE|nr:alcohol dehydrogenase [Cutaneotrichosporon oleaginosum]KLT39613.1 alcohol dehydrogenase [Cutaneotrichosporon oleaginosum]TXT05634.1 hypothetical protein COLE_06954 [Cutaneotrichosporon oleaginosum]
MKAVQISKFAHPRDIPVSEVPKPVPKAGEVLVEISATGLNFFDILQSQGKYQNQPPMPFILGAEFAGRVAKDSPIPAGCPFKAGDRVFGYAQGSHAEYVAVDHEKLLAVPPNITLAQAAGLYLTYPTSYEGLVGRANTQPGEWVLVHAAAGGVGLAACQIAKVLGAKVIACVGSPAKGKVATEQGGADYVVDYTKAGWQDEVKKITNGHGVDVVYDPVGMLIPSLKCIAWNGRLVVVGFVAGTIEKVPANLVLLKNCSIVGLFWGATAIRDPPRYKHVIKETLRMVAEGKLTPTVFEPVYEGLEGVTKGLLDLEGRKTYGKVVVSVRKDAKL